MNGTSELNDAFVDSLISIDNIQIPINSIINNAKKYEYISS